MYSVLFLTTFITFCLLCSRIQFVFILHEGKIQQSGMTIDITQRK